MNDTEERAPSVQGGVPTILILVVSTDREPWRDIEVNGQRQTWAAPSSVPSGCRVIYYYGTGMGSRRHAARVTARLMRANPQHSLRAKLGTYLTRSLSARAAGAHCELLGDQLWTRVPEVYWFLLPKLIAALRWATTALPPFDYVYRPNVSSYVDLARLRETASRMPRQACYAGYPGRPPAEGPTFASGAGILMSWDVAVSVAQYRGWRWGAIDDVAVGECCADLGIGLVPLPRVDLTDPQSAELITDDELRSVFHFRCKSGGDALRSDVATMVRLHQRIEKLRSS